MIPYFFTFLACLPWSDDELLLEHLSQCWENQTLEEACDTIADLLSHESHRPENIRQIALQRLANEVLARRDWEHAVEFLEEIDQRLACWALKTSSAALPFGAGLAEASLESLKSSYRINLMLYQAMMPSIAISAAVLGINPPRKLGYFNPIRQIAQAVESFPRP